MFEFHVDPRARIYAAGNVVEGSPEASLDNRLAIFYGQKLRKLTPAEKAAMIVETPFGDVPSKLESAAQARATVLDDAGAALPARDPVDLRIVDSVRHGSGRVIERETDLAERDRWPEYHSLPAPVDSDEDGLPDFWEKQYGLNPHDPTDSPKIAAGGYANIEHYLNNTSPTGDAAPIVWISAPISRAGLRETERGQWRVYRTGPLAHELVVSYAFSGTVQRPAALSDRGARVTIPAGAASAEIPFSPESGAADGATAVVTLAPAESYHVGCPSAAMIVVQK
jgi:hypothetical protein